jgi:mannose-6-phosphate isomerase-like protein (cupin superfamily)
MRSGVQSRRATIPPGEDTMPTATQVPSLRITRHEEIMGRHEAGKPWAEVFLDDGRNYAVWISGPPGHPPDPHIHPDFNEWWLALDGVTRWQIGQYEPVDAEWGDIVMAPAGYAHDIRPIEGPQAIRLGVTHPKSNHDIKGIAPCRTLPLDRDLSEPNLIHTSFADLKRRYGTDTGWKHIAVLDERNRVLITHEMPGTVNRRMWHPGMRKWWAVLQGRIGWSIGDSEKVEAGPGDIVMVKAEEVHEIRTLGDEPSVRVTVTAPDIVHYYVD